MPVTEEWNRILRDCDGELAAVEGNLLSAAKGKEVRTLFVTSCRPGEGKTTTAASVAQALAVQAGAGTLLVDAHLAAHVLDGGLAPGGWDSTPRPGLAPSAGRRHSVRRALLGKPALPLASRPRASLREEASRPRSNPCARPAPGR